MATTYIYVGLGSNLYEDGIQFKRNKKVLGDQRQICEDLMEETSIHSVGGCVGVCVCLCVGVCLCVCLCVGG